jgi:hypothetical protein
MTAFQIVHSPFGRQRFFFFFIWLKSFKLHPTSILNNLLFRCINHRLLFFFSVLFLFALSSYSSEICMFLFLSDFQWLIVFAVFIHLFRFKLLVILIVFIVDFFTCIRYISLYYVSLCICLSICLSFRLPILIGLIVDLSTLFLPFARLSKLLHAIVMFQSPKSDLQWTDNESRLQWKESTGPLHLLSSKDF